MIILNVYRSPKHAHCHVSKFFNHIEDLLNFLLPAAKTFILCGDLNIDLLQKSSNRSELLRIFNSFGLKSFVNSPTRVAGSSATCIDHVFANLHETELFVETITTAVSDHYGNFLFLPHHTFHASSPDFIIKRSFKKDNYDSFEELLAHYNWNFILSDEVSTNEKFSLYLSKVVEFFNKAFPKQKIRIKNSQKPWRTAELKAKGQQVKLLYDDYRFCKSPAAKAKYRAEKKAYDKSIKTAMRDYFSTKLEKADNKVKCAWKLINNKRNKKENDYCCKEIVSDGKTITEPYRICEIFNRFFVNISTTSTGGAIPEILGLINDSPSQLCISEFDAEDVKKAISDINNKTTAGEDEISVGLISKFSHHFVPHLVTLFNACLKEGIFPSALKISKVRPLFKKGDHKDVNNYRPIALTSAFSKIFEKAIALRVTDFLEDNNLFHPSQFGYRKSISTANAIDFSLDIIVRGLEDKQSTIGVFLDLSKAFDRVEFNILLTILRKLGFHLSLINLLHSFLTDRKQFVVLSHNDKEYRSSLLTPTCSVPQGSILGPLLFLIYINFIPTLADVKNVCMFCDDTTLIYKAPDNKENEISIYASLNNYIQILQQFNLTVNQSKTKFMNFKSYGGARNCDLSVFIDGSEVEQVDHLKFLGVYIDEMLTWNHHVSNLLDKLSSVLFLLKRISYICTLQVRIMVYHACFHSNISYCLLLWGNTSLSNLQQVLVYQKSALRLIFHLKKDTSCKNYFQNHRIFTVFAQYVFLLLVNIKRNEHKLQTVAAVHNYPTRSGHLLKTERSRLKISSQSPLQNGIKYFNLLPLRCRNLGLSAFRKTLKVALINLAPYNLNEIEIFLPKIELNDK